MWRHRVCPVPRYHSPEGTEYQQNVTISLGILAGLPRKLSLAEEVYFPPRFVASEPGAAEDADEHKDPKMSKDMRKLSFTEMIYGDAPAGAERNDASGDAAEQLTPQAAEETAREYAADAEMAAQVERMTTVATIEPVEPGVDESARETKRLCADASASDASMPEVIVTEVSAGAANAPAANAAAWPSGAYGGENGNGHRNHDGIGSDGNRGDAGHGNHGHAGTPSTHGHSQGNERRRRRRALISAPVRIRPVHLTDAGPMEVTTTLDVSRAGIFFVTDLNTYARAMDVAVVFPYSGIPGEVYAEQIGRVVRVVEYEDGRRGIALSFEKSAANEEALIDSSGRNVKLAGAAGRAAGAASHKDYSHVKVLVVESDERARQTMSSYLQGEGYNALGLPSGTLAREVLAVHVPAVVIAEIEGDGMMGYELCAYIKSDERLRHVPVILTTRSAYPSDYANAHAVGAIICMAKPFKQEKLGHMVRLLAPPKRKEADSDAQHLLPRSGKGRKALPTRQSYGVAKQPNEFHKLCNEAVIEKRQRDNGDRYDASDTDTSTESSAKESKSADQPRGFSVFRSLFKR